MSLTDKNGVHLGLEDATGKRLGGRRGKVRQRYLRVGGRAWERERDREKGERKRDRRNIMERDGVWERAREWEWWEKDRETETREGLQDINKAANGCAVQAWVEPLAWFILIVSLHTTPLSITALTPCLNLLSTHPPHSQEKDTLKASFHHTLLSYKCIQYLWKESPVSVSVSIRTALQCGEVFRTDRFTLSGFSPCSVCWITFKNKDGERKRESKRGGRGCDSLYLLSGNCFYLWTLYNIKPVRW